MYVVYIAFDDFVCVRIKMAAEYDLVENHSAPADPGSYGYLGPTSDIVDNMLTTYQHLYDGVSVALNYKLLVECGDCCFGLRFCTKRQRLPNTK